MSSLLLQQALVGLIVLASAAYASWRLMPAAWRRALARRMGRPAPTSGGCGGCSGGCASPPPPGTPRPGDARPITLHRRPPLTGR